MIVFDLKCSCGCQFEGWFESRSDFDRQIQVNMIACPHCGSVEIHKILSPVAIHAGVPDTAGQPVNDREEMDADAALKILREVQDYVEKNFDDVGSRLAEESLKIHYGVSRSRNIRGVATADEEKMLLAEGIELLKIPMLKKPTDPKAN